MKSHMYWDSVPVIRATWKLTSRRRSIYHHVLFWFHFTFFSSYFGLFHGYFRLFWVTSDEAPGQQVSGSSSAPTDTSLASLRILVDKEISTRSAVPSTSCTPTVNDKASRLTRTTSTSKPQVKGASSPEHNLTGCNKQEKIYYMTNYMER